MDAPDEGHPRGNSGGNIAHVSLITLGVTDLDRASDFYAALGWERSSASVPGTVTFFHGSTAALALFDREDLAEDANVPATSLEGSPAVALAMNVDSERAVDDFLNRAREAGATITKNAQRADWGGYSGYFRDPDGYLWEVARNPGFELRSDGGVVLPDR